MSYFFSYIKFLLSATNQHGVHSPFVYAFVTKCVYNKKGYSKQTSLNLFLKSLEYFNIKNVNISDVDQKVRLQISHSFPHIKLDSSSNNFWYISCLKEERLSKLMQQAQFQNDSIVFIDGIFKDKKAWESLIVSDKIRVSINFFYGGILFFRKEQVKEDFKIRT